MSERPTPHSIAVCTLIALHSSPTSPIHSSSSPTSSSSSSSSRNSTTSTISHLLQKLILSPSDGWRPPLSHTTLTLSSLLSHISSSSSSSSSSTTIATSKGNINNTKKNKNDEQNQTISRLLHDNLNESSSSIDSLVDFFSSLRHIITSGHVDGNSAYGIYLRKRCLGFDKLSFESVSRLWMALRDYVNEASGIADDDDDNEGKDDFDNQPPTTTTTTSTTTKWSLPPTQIAHSLLTHIPTLPPTIGTIPYHHTESTLSQTLRHSPELPAAHFYRFLNCLFYSERVGALDSLHRYFDYAMIHERRMPPVPPVSMPPTTPAERNAAASSNNNSAANNANQQPRSVLHYAPILLAMSHVTFGDYDLGRKATEEALRVAQLSGDGGCVAYALGWSARQGGLSSSGRGRSSSSHVRGGEREETTSDDDAVLLRRCASRARSEGLDDLAVGAMLSLAPTVLAQSSSSTPILPRDAWSCCINQNQTTTATTQNGRRLLTCSGIWESFGLWGRASLEAGTALHVYGEELMSVDFARGVHNVAMSALYGPCGDLLAGTLDGEGLLQLSPSRLTLSSNSSSKRRGRKKASSSSSSSSLSHPRTVYTKALDKLIKLKKRYPHPPDNVFRHTVALLLTKWAIHRNETTKARALSLRLHSHPSSSASPTETIQSLTEHVDLLLSENAITDAKRLLHTLLSSSNQSSSSSLTKPHPYHHARLLLRQAQIQFDCHPNNPYLALPPLLQCLSYTQSQSIDPLHAAALSLLSNVHRREGYHVRASAFLSSCLPSLISHASPDLVGEVWLGWGVCLVQDGRYEKGVRCLSEARECFGRVDEVAKVRECCYLMARVWNLLGERGRRDECARRWRELGGKGGGKGRCFDVRVCVGDLEVLEKLAAM